MTQSAPITPSRLRLLPTRHLQPHVHLGAPFGSDRFGRLAERFARAFGAPYFLIGQTIVVAAWIVMNAAAKSAFDPFPFILLNLAFSLQAAYAAPLILLAETRQADRDRVWTDADANHREELANRTLELIEQNTAITQQVQALLRQNTDLTERVAGLSEQIAGLTRQIHGRVVSGA